MSLTKFTGATNWIRSLINKPTKPASELKEDFDKAGDLIKTYINETLTEEIDTQLENKANNSDVYSKTETDTLLGKKANNSNVDTLLGEKANSADVYTKAQSNTNFKANGDFTSIEVNLRGDTGSLSNTDVNYPEGFTKDNCVITSTLQKTVSGSGWNAIPYGSYDNNYIVVILETTKIRLVSNLGSNYIAKIVLMKIS